MERADRERAAARRVELGEHALEPAVLAPLPLAQRAELGAQLGRELGHAVDARPAAPRAPVVAVRALLRERDELGVLDRAAAVGVVLVDERADLRVGEREAELVDVV